MGLTELKQVLRREDVPSDVLQTIREYVDEEHLVPKEKLLEDNEILSAVLETSPVGICLLTGHIIGWTNETMASMLQYEPDSSGVNNFKTLFANIKEFNKVNTALSVASAKGNILKIDTTWVRKDGSVIDVLLHARPLDISNLGKGTIIATLDLSERKKSERARRESEEKYRDLVERANDGIVIKVNLEIFPSTIQIKVEDNGAGIKAGDLQKIFDQFVSIETEYSASGTGIGLYLSRKIISAHNGNITAKSKGRGYGASFIIELPRK